MAEKKPVLPSLIPTPQNSILLLSQAYKQLSNKVSLMDIKIEKATANFEILNNKLDLLKSTIELLEKKLNG